MKNPDAVRELPTLFGHPTGLFTLFFAEMWERFSYYGMRALLVFYMTKGFMKASDSDAYTVYGAYTALVYMTPFIGGMLADKLLGARRAVVLGGLLMAAGHLLMTQETPLMFSLALALLITGNGFFKPNISSIVGTLYAPESPKRDGGFTIFYVGINMGAAMSPLLCGYIGENYGYHYGFGLATIGMLIGLAVFVMPTLVTQVLILIGAGLAAFGLCYYHAPPDTSAGMAATAINVFLAITLIAAGCIAFVALGRGGLPQFAGSPKSGQVKGMLPVLFGTFVAIPVFALFVSGFSIATKDGKPISLIPEATIKSVAESGPSGKLASVFLDGISKPAGLILAVTGILALIYLFKEMAGMEKIPRHRMYVVLILTFFSLLFWAFFEQAGSSINNFTDRNIDRVAETDRIEADMVGQTIEIEPTQEQLGHTNGGKMFTIDQLTRLRQDSSGDSTKIKWDIDASNIGMGIASRQNELPASTYQAVNPTFILIFGLLFSMLWTYLGSIKMEPSTPVKFALSLLQLGLGFLVLWFGAKNCSDRGMVAAYWLFLAYLLHTTGELCLSPVGLSMVTKLTPTHLVSTVMGTWFLATAFSQYLAGIISQFTGVSEGSGAETTIPPPLETVHVYGDVFKTIGWASVASGVICLILAPLLSYWMHADSLDDQPSSSGH